MCMKRTDVYTGFKDRFSKTKDNRSMDELCTSSDEGFQLQAQQSFLKEFISENDGKWNKLLLYHQIGSGKTCTAITLAEKYTEMHPEAKVTVLLPARLRTNFLDELITPCGMNKYISDRNFERYHSSSTGASDKANIKRAFTKAINKKYDVMSFEKFRSQAAKFAKLSKWVKAVTKNRLIIIDEVHNLISSSYNPKQYNTILQTDKLSAKMSGINTILFKYLTSFADPSCKMLLLTATPVFDNLVQLKELVQALNPDAKFVGRDERISKIVEQIRGKVSFFPGTSPNAYPGVEYVTHEVPLSKLQDSQISKLDEKKEELKEAFMIQQRQISIAVKNKSLVNIVKNIDEFAPKVRDVISTIQSLQGKHIIYCTFIESGLNIVEAELKNEGWINYLDVKDSPKMMTKYSGKIYAHWNGSTSDDNKVLIKRIVNSVDNIEGNVIRVVLGSPSIKEGVSFKHVQHLHIMDPVWNTSAKAQIEGRAIRFCSHIDIPKDHEFLKRKVVVHIYKSVPRTGGKVDETADQSIYDDILPRKEEAIKAAEKALKKVSIDYYLFRRMYRDHKTLSPVTNTEDGKTSLLNITSFDKPIYGQLNGATGVKNTCPKPRRPDPKTKKCPPDQYALKNSRGDLCCYKNKLAGKSKSTCPKARRPDKVTGMCPSGMESKQNKHGEPCCYKS